jgi:hypothetical protein
MILAFLQYHLRNISLPYISSRDLKFSARKYASDRPIHRYFRSICIATPLYLLGFHSILVISSAVLTISKGRTVLIRRSGEGVSINLILLSVCSRPNIFSECVHVSHQFISFIHRWLSIVAIIECAVHLTAALSRIWPSTRPFASVSSIAGLTISYNQV